MSELQKLGQVNLENSPCGTRRFERSVQEESQLPQYRDPYDTDAQMRDRFLPRTLQGQVAEIEKLKSDLDNQIGRRHD